MAARRREVDGFCFIGHNAGILHDTVEPRANKLWRVRSELLREHFELTADLGVILIHDLSRQDHAIFDELVVPRNETSKLKRQSCQHHSDVFVDTRRTIPDRAAIMTETRQKLPKPSILHNMT